MRTVFDTKCVACLHRCNETGKFVFATDSKYTVCLDEKRKVFRGFCRFIIMFEHVTMCDICYASSARKYDVTARFL